MLSNSTIPDVARTDVAVAVEMAIVSPFYDRSYTRYRDCDPGMRPALNGVRRRLALLEGG
ncbi:MAG: hypothetical protein ACRELD_08430 [Longimicrobiales bacterium]